MAMTILHQDEDIIVVSPYTYTGQRDIYIKTLHPYWSQSIIGNDYKILINRQDRRLIGATNEFYLEAYAAIETSLVGDVLILGAGLQLLDGFLVTGSSWLWIEQNAYLASIAPANGTIQQGNANDVDWLATLGTFDTVLVDFSPDHPIKDYDSLLNIGGSVIYFQI